MAKKLNPEWKIPEHVAIIMDGNGRWAKKRGLPRMAGHTEGVKTLKRIARYCGEIGVKYVRFRRLGEKCIAADTITYG